MKILLLGREGIHLRKKRRVNILKTEKTF